MMTLPPGITLLEGGGSSEPVDGKCGSKKQTGPGYCMHDPMDGRTRCYNHGGKTPVGALSPHFKHGLRSAYMPQRLLPRFETAQSDPELLSVLNSAAIVQARVDELLEQVYEGEAGANWRELKKLWSQFQRHKRSGNVPGMQEALELIDQPMERGFAGHAAWEELGLQLDRHARLVAQEQKRRDKLQAMMTVEDGIGMLGTITDVIRRHCSPEQQTAIAAELAQLVTIDAVPVAGRSRRR